MNRKVRDEFNELLKEVDAPKPVASTTTSTSIVRAPTSVALASSLEFFVIEDQVVGVAGTPSSVDLWVMWTSQTYDTAGEAVQKALKLSAQQLGRYFRVSRVRNPFGYRIAMHYPKEALGAVYHNGKAINLDVYRVT